MNRAGELHPGTQCVHGGWDARDGSGDLVVPLHQTTTYAWRDLDHPPPITYARSGNPTTEALERRLALLERGASAVCFGSGLAAIDALVRSLPTGGRIVAGRHLYGGTTRLLHRLHASSHPLEVVDSSDEAALESALDQPTSLVLVESPSNPTLQVTDLKRVADRSHAVGALVAVDNTLLTPLYQRPLELGADVSLHSTTKYLDGHDATLGGAVVVSAALSGEGDSDQGPLAARLRWVRKATGSLMAPFEAWLTLQGVKTLHLRTRAQWASAARGAGAILGHPAVSKVYYPGLPEHPGHRVHRGQAEGDGGLVALDLGTYRAAREFVSHLRVFTLAENLGSTESLATHPASMTHADLSPERRRADGITEGLVRLSFGVEDPLDLEEDLLGALEHLPSSREVAA